MGTRIVHLADYGGPYAGSFVPMLRGLAVTAQQRGHQTSMCFSETARGRGWVAELERVTDVQFLAAGHGPPVAREVHRLLGSRKEATVLHTHFGRFDVAAALAAAGRPRTAVFWHKHNLLLPRALVRIRNTARFLVCAPRVAGALCVTPEIRAAMVERGFPARKAHYLANAIDLERFPPISADEREQARKRLGLPAHAKVVLHFAWDWLLKGGDLLLEAAEILTASRSDVLIATVLGERAPAAVLDAVRAHPWIRILEPSPHVNAYYAAADVFVSTSRVEGVNYALLEALARGLPVVATVMPGQRGMISGVPGTRIVAGEGRAVAAALEELLSRAEDERAGEAAAARRALEESFSLGPWVERVLDFYVHALAQSGAHRQAGS
jgi:glycosyltransferase involved in cell wall biosynthesis